MNKLYALMLILTGIALGRIDLRFNPAIYSRYVDNTDETPSSFNLMAAELMITGNMSHENRDVLTGAAQICIAGTMHGWAKSMHQGIAYINIPIGIGKPSIKIGQQVIPFGLLAWYDTHGRVFQNPYAFTIGERIDAGISAQGLIGPVDYWYMISNGSGPNIMDQNNNKVQTIRIAYTNNSNWYDLIAGLSLLRGILPNFSDDPFRNMMAEPDSLIMKNRVAIDGKFSNPYFELIGELIIGTDGSWHSISDLSDQGNLGAYLEFNIPMIAGIETIGMYSYWQADLNGDIKKTKPNSISSPYSGMETRAERSPLT